MKKSESIKNIGTAIMKFHQLMGKIKKDSKNPFFKSAYLSLSGMLDGVKEPLHEAGLCFTQFPSEASGLTSLLIHPESGEFLEDTYVMTPTKNDPQGIGSSLTYQRRYALGAILGINIADDDDGNAASQPTQRMPVGNSNQTATGAKVPMTEAIFNSTKAAMTAAKSDPTMRSPKDTLEAAKKAMDIQANWLTELELLAK